MIQQACDEDPPEGSWGKDVTIYFVCEDATVLHHEITKKVVETSITEPS